MIGENIKSLRRTHHLTQSDLAKIVVFQGIALAVMKMGQVLFQQSS